MMVDDLLSTDNISLTSNVATNVVDNNLFESHFWGEKHNGFDVLYHNMKHGQVSVKFLQDFIRDSANIQDIHSKHLTKLARQAANSSAVGTFYPMFDVLKVTAEKLSSCHTDVYHKLHEIIKDLSKYVEEQKGKHKQVKDELSGTVNALALIHNTKASVTKSKEKYHNFCMETEKLRNSAALPKEIEKSEAKTKKAGEEYRHLVEKYSNVRNDFDHKMTESAKRFQDVEESHLKHMKSVLDSYILSFENANVLIGQVHQEFRRQIDESTIHSLIKHFSENKGTGIEKPAPIAFEECDVGAMLVSIDNVNTNGAITDDNQPPLASKGGRRPITLPFRRKKGRKTQKDTPTHASAKDKDTESIESPEKDSSLHKEPSANVDEEGFTIRPETPKGSKSSWGMDSSNDSDSDSDDISARKIHVKINPKDHASAVNNDINALNAITKNLTLSSPTPIIGGKRVSPGEARSRRQRDSPASSQPEGLLGDELLDLFGQNSAPSKPTKDDKFSDLNDLFSNQRPATPKLTPQSSDISLNNLFTTASDSNLSASKPDITLSNPDSDISPALRPKNLPVKTIEDKSASISAPLASSESWSSLSSLGGGTPMESFTASRGPSPLTLMRNDPIPIAVAFTEVLNAYIKGTEENQCMVKVTGDIQLSFPAGIVRAFTSSPNPPMLSFSVKKGLQNIEFAPKSNLLFSDSSGVENNFWFDMPSLISLVKKQFDSNPSLPYCIVSVLTYQLSSQNGYSLIPLHISNKWNCTAETTDVNIQYSYNSNWFKSPLKNVSFIVPVNGAANIVKSHPSANWIAAQNRLSWKLPTSISVTTSTGSLSSELCVTKGPSKSCALAVQFMSEGALLSGCEFELTGQGYRLSLVKKKVISGKYLADAS